MKQKQEYILLNWYPSLPLAWKNKEEVRITQNAKGNYIGDADGIPHYLPRVEVHNNPLFWVKVTKTSFVDDIIDEPIRAIINSNQTPAIPYEKIQHRADFIGNFKNGWKLYKTNHLFRTITMLMMNGVSIYDIFLELVFMIEGKTLPETSYLNLHKDNQNETK